MKSYVTGWEDSGTDAHEVPLTQVLSLLIFFNPHSQCDKAKETEAWKDRDLAAYLLTHTKPSQETDGLAWLWVFFMIFSKSQTFSEPGFSTAKLEEVCSCTYTHTHTHTHKARMHARKARTYTSIHTLCVHRSFLQMLFLEPTTPLPFYLSHDFYLSDFQKLPLPPVMPSTHQRWPGTCSHSTDYHRHPLTQLPLK